MIVVTPWFPGSVKPARPGVYEREWPHKALYAEWTGYQWLRSTLTAKAAVRQREISAHQDGIRWRGLANDPWLGAIVTVCGQEGIYRGENTKILGDVLVQFPNTGHWSYARSDVVFR